MAAASFLALAHTLKRGEHIRVTLFLDRFGGALPPAARALVPSRRARSSARALALFSVRLVWQSRAFNDISQGNDATPLWIPQIAHGAWARSCCSWRWSTTSCCVLRGATPARRRRATS